jgi:hypothetical protein
MAILWGSFILGSVGLAILSTVVTCVISPVLCGRKPISAEKTRLMSFTRLGFDRRKLLCLNYLDRMLQKLYNLANDGDTRARSVSEDA